MKEQTKKLFFQPFNRQELVSVAILIPTVFFLFDNAAPGFRENILEAALYASLAGLVGCILGMLAKYLYVKPAIEIMEQESPSRDEVLRALRSVSLMPLIEAVTVFIRWAVLATIICIGPFYVKGYIDTNTAIFGMNCLIMNALAFIPYNYLASENSLVQFYTRCNFRGILDDQDRSKLFRMDITSKLLFTVLFIVISPIGNLLGLIYQSINSGVNLEHVQFGFFLIVFETVAMTLLNAWLLMKTLKLSVGKMSFMLQDMAKGQGDLTKRLEVTGINEVGELAFWFNTFMEDIEQIVAHVRESSLELHHSIEGVSAGSQGLSQATQEQAASVEEITASIEELNGTVRQNADLIREGQEASNAITRLINQNKQVFGALMTATQEISQDSQKIGDIVSTVNEVAFHTNLLALNASVEAARAGEHGKGFAVVAGEVRSLAQRSAEAAREIKSLIEGTVDKIMLGDEVMKKTTQSMEDLMGRMESFFSMMEVISTSSMEQTQNIGELGRAITQIDASTQSNASTVEELASTLDNLRTVATILAEDVQKFKTSVAN
ncbi:MAG TPA: methyl-accepting chemotaxis protein [Deltaproteobacteria bacterium]|nr:methyl-accepting chemotaxis protein [Deltaproteobacteria bacterium]HOI05670.1 methyl-accepting chemotaxis protein [Deltaproteobacteria bacterium]